MTERLVRNHEGDIGATASTVDRRPMTEKERVLALALGRCRFSAAATQKRFAEKMAAIAAGPDPRVTEKQGAFIVRLAWDCRRQLPADIRPTAKPLPKSATRQPNELRDVITKGPLL